VQQLINKIINSEAECDYNYLTKFNSITPYYTESTITPIDCTTLGPANYTQRDSSTAPHCFYTAKNKGQGTKNPSHAAHPVPQTPTTTPDEDITSHITDTLLERTDSPGHIAR